MKRLLLIIAFIFIYSSKPFAQTIKIAYVNIDSIVGLIPELKNVDLDTVGSYYVEKVVRPRVEKLNLDYQRKLKQAMELHGTDKKESARLQNEIEEIAMELGYVDEYVEQTKESKQREFLEPFYKKARKAIKVVADRSAYTHVISSNIVIVGPPIDNIDTEVIAELKIGR